MNLLSFQLNDRRGIKRGMFLNSLRKGRRTCNRDRRGTSYRGKSRWNRDGILGRGGSRLRRRLRCRNSRSLLRGLRGVVRLKGEMGKGLMV